MPIPVTGTGYYPTDLQGAQAIYSVVHRGFNPFIIEQAFRKKPVFLSMVLKDLAKPRGGGFSPITQPVYFSDWGANVTKLSWTSEVQASPIQYPMTVAQWNMAGYAVVIDTLLTEWSLMQGAGEPWKVIDTIKARFTDFYMAMVDTIDSKILSAPASADEMDGLRNAIDDGTTYATYGGLSRTTYPNWAAPKYDASGTYESGKEWQSVIYALYKYKHNIPGDVPNAVLCSYGVFYTLAKSLTTIDRIITSTPQEGVDLSRTYAIQALNLQGLYIIPIDKITDNTAYFCNFKYFEMPVNPDLFFSMTETTSLLPVRTLGWTTAVVFAGNFICYRPRYSFKVINMPSVTF